MLRSSEDLRSLSRSGWSNVLWQECCIFRFLLFAALFAAAPAFSAVSPMWDAAYVSGTVTSHTRGFPRFQGMRDAPSGLFPSDRVRPIGSLVAAIWSLFTTLQIKSLIWECKMCFGSLFRHDGPLSPLALTMAPQMHVRLAWYAAEAESDSNTDCFVRQT